MLKPTAQWGTIAPGEDLDPSRSGEDMRSDKPAPRKPVLRGFDTSKAFREDCLVRLRELYKDIDRLEESMRELKTSVEAREKEMNQIDESWVALPG